MMGIDNNNNNNLYLYAPFIDEMQPKVLYNKEMTCTKCFTLKRHRMNIKTVIQKKAHDKIHKINLHMNKTHLIKQEKRE